jgi:hypothetical protein
VSVLLPKKYEFPSWDSLALLGDKYIITLQLEHALFIIEQFIPGSVALCLD